MSRSLFSASPFRPIYGDRMVRVQGLGQGITDIFGEGAEAVSKLFGELDGLIEKLPVGIAGPYGKRRDDCMRKSTIEQYVCLYKLFQDIKQALKDEEDRPKTPVVIPPKPSTSGGLPLVPMVVGSIAVAAVLYAVFKG